MHYPGVVTTTAAELGADIRRARQQAGLTQAELADRTGTTQSVVARWERGAVEPRITTLGRISDALGGRLLVELEPPVSPAEWASVEDNLRLTPAERSARLVAAVRFVLAGRSAMQAADRG